MEKGELEKLIDLRRKLHQCAEVSGNEEETASVVERFVSEHQPDRIVTEIGGHGLAACFSGSEPGPKVLVRADLDGLPIPETVKLDYGSKNPGASHKCGHDGHMAMVAGLAAELARTPPRRGEVILLFQPAEEIGQGARWMLEDEKMGRLAPDYVYALHNLPGRELGEVVVREGTFAAGSVGLIVELEGATSHAAEPHMGKSPALAVSQLISELSAMPQFQTALYEAAKVTVIHAKVGEVAFGTSPGTGEVMATIRAYRGEVMSRLKERCVTKIQALATAHELEMSYRWVEEFPPTVNDARCVGRITEAASGLGLSIDRREYPFPWSEDFGNFTASHCGAMFGLGSGLSQPALHHPTYDFPDELIETGVTLFRDIVRSHVGA